MYKYRATESRTTARQAQRESRKELSRVQRLLKDQERSWLVDQIDRMHALIDRRARHGEMSAVMEYAYFIKKSAMLVRVQKIQHVLTNEGYVVTIAEKKDPTYVSLTVSW